MSERLCVVMPVYNEEEAIGGVLKKWSGALTKLGIDFTIRPYNDGSKDSSLKVMRDFVAANPNSHVEVRDKPNGGHGNTILTGYRDAVADGFDWIFQIDSDDEMGPEKFGELWSRRNDYDFLVGIRDGRIQALPRKVISFVSRCCVKFFYGLKTIWDVNTPYRLMRTSAFAEIYKQIPLTTFAPNVIISGMVARQHLRFFETRVPQHDRTTGEVSIKKWKLLKAAARSFCQTIAFSFDRTRWFGVLAAVISVIALGWMTAGFTDFTFSKLTSYFSNPRAFNDFYNMKACAESASHFQPDGYPTWDAPYAAICYQIVQLFPSSHAGAVIFSLLSALLYLLGVGLFVRERKLPLISSLLLVAFSGVFIRTIERGNPIFLAAAAVCVFFAYYDSDKKWKRYFAAVSLALAAVLKVGPAIFGIMYVPQLLRPKTWKIREIVVFVVASVLLLVVPFFLFDYNGFADIRQWIANAQENGRHYAIMGNFGLPACFSWLNDTCKALGHPLSFMGMVASRPFSAAFGLLVFIGVLFCKNQTIKLFLAASAMVLIPGNSFAYCLLYFFPIILWILNSQAQWEGLLLLLLIFPAVTLSIAGVSLGIPFINIGVMAISAYYCLRIALHKDR